MTCACGKASVVLEVTWDKNHAPCQECYDKMLKKHNKFEISDRYRKVFKEK